MSGDQRKTRREYARTELRRHDLDPTPLLLFSKWLQAATDEKLVDATAMTLATADTDGRPSARIVLLKHFDEAGFVWYSGYNSQKGQELAENPQATLLFYWREFERQVRITGVVGREPKDASAAYFQSRPSDSRLSAAASDQSSPIESRDALQAKVTELERRYEGADVPMPAEWGGYRLQAEEYEFWQGRVGRLHDRFRYRKTSTGWHIERLQP